MNKLMEQTLLYDFYGELLTERQRAVYEAFVFQDLSLGEIAEAAGISRQGVHDLIKRSGRQLDEYESKLHLVQKFVDAKEKIHMIRQLFQEQQQNMDADTGAKIDRLLEEVLEQF